MNFLFLFFIVIPSTPEVDALEPNLIFVDYCVPLGALTIWHSTL